MQWLACDAGCHSHFAAHPAERPAGHGQNAGSTVDSPRDGGRDLRSLVILKQAESRETAARNFVRSALVRAYDVVHFRAFTAFHSANEERQLMGSAIEPLLSGLLKAGTLKPSSLQPAHFHRLTSCTLQASPLFEPRVQGSSPGKKVHIRSLYSHTAGHLAGATCCSQDTALPQASDRASAPPLLRLQLLLWPCISGVRLPQPVQPLVADAVIGHRLDGQVGRG